MNDSLFETVKSLIVKLRRNEDVDNSWEEFRQLVESNIEEILDTFNSRWLVSICDTYADYGTPGEKKNAIIISIVANFERLWATNLLMYDLKLNSKKLADLKAKYPIELWDGMTSFAICDGDTTNNLFGRIESILADTPELLYVYKTLLKRISENDTVLANLNVYHRRLFESEHIPIWHRYLLLRIIKAVLNRFRQR